MGNVFLKLFILLLLVGAFLVLLKVLLLQSYPDFSSYYFAPKSLFQHQNPYIGGKHYFTPFVYPPIVIVFFLPFSLLSYVLAQKLWVGVSIVLLIASVFLLLRSYKQQVLSLRSASIFILVFLAFPTKFTLGMGQVNMVIVFLLSLCFYYLLKGKQKLVGIFLAFSVAIKLFPGLLLLYFIIKKQWIILISFLITILSISVVCYVVVGPKLISYFIFIVLPSLLTSWKSDYYNQAFSGFLAREITHLPARELLQMGGTIFAMAISLIAVFLHRKNKDLVPLSFSVMITTSLLFNAFSWQHHFVFLLVPYSATYFFIQHKKNYYYCLFILLLSYICVAINVKNPTELIPILQSHVFYGGCLLWLLQLYLLITYDK